MTHGDVQEIDNESHVLQGKFEGTQDEKDSKNHAYATQSYAFGKTEKSMAYKYCESIKTLNKNKLKKLETAPFDKTSGLPNYCDVINGVTCCELIKATRAALKYV